MIHNDGDNGHVVLGGGEGNDTLIGRSGDHFYAGEANIINVDAPLNGVSHDTYVSVYDYESDFRSISEVKEGWLTLNFPEGTKGSVVVVKSFAYHEKGYYKHDADVYFVPEEDASDPGTDQANGAQYTLIATIELTEATEKSAAYPNLEGAISAGDMEVTLISFETDY